MQRAPAAGKGPPRQRVSRVILRKELPLVLTGFMAVLCGVGLSRFAYTALMPVMVQAGWFTPSQTAYLGAANLLGYLIGALSAHALTERLGVRRVLGGCLATVALSFALSSTAQPFATFFLWRFAAGVAGAILMVVGPSAGMAAAPPQRRAALGPLMFTGVGAGALLSATVVPTLASQGLEVVWWALALLGALAAWVGWRACAHLHPPAGPGAQPPEPLGALPLLRPSRAVVLVMLAYACDAAGFIPHTVFWVDYLAREQQLGAAYAASQWAFFGLGAIAGPLLSSACASRWDWPRTLSGGYAIKAVGVGLPLLVFSFGGHAVSSFLVGALSPGLAALTSGRLMQLVGPRHHKQYWGYATAVFALMQAVSGYAMAWLYGAAGQYRPLFVAGLVCMSLGLCLAWLSGRGTRSSATAPR